MYGVVRLHVKESYFVTPPVQVTSPTLGPPATCKQALTIHVQLYTKKTL